MRLVTWNCNGNFKDKFKEVLQLDADIYVIQECENPSNTLNKDYKEFSKNSLWVGGQKKGLGIFSKESISIKDNNWPCDEDMNYYLSCTINNELTLLGVWSHEKRGYIKEVYDYLDLNKHNLITKEKLMICGDFNSNAQWDKRYGKKNHSSVVNKLKELNLYSSYHLFNNEEHGKESTPTLYWRKNIAAPYHIDYIFYDMEKIITIDIGDYSNWINLSDHVPLILDFKI